MNIFAGSTRNYEEALLIRRSPQLGITTAKAA